jgi:PAP2 superfamily
MTPRLATRFLALLALAASPACSGEREAPEVSEEFAGTPSGETIVRWSENNFALLTTLDNGSPSGLQLIRELAIVHIAMHDAANAVDPQYNRYVLDVEDPAADPALAAAAAAHAAAVTLRPGKQAQADAFLQTDLDAVTDPDKRQRSLDIGAAAADAIIAARQDDGFFDTVPYTFGPPEPGVWQPVPPSGTNVVGPHFPFVTPLGISSASQFRSPPPPALSSSEWLDDYNEVKEIGRSDSTTRTADQTAIALFWREQTQFAWNNIARTVANQNDKGLFDTARAFALLNMGLFDGLIANFDTKYHYTYWRPYTAIREVDDGRSDTEMDPTWLPLNSTPGHPEYTSSTAAMGAASAFPLTQIYGGSTGFTITTSTADPPGSTRSYSSFDHAAQESGESRVYAGIHFGFSVESTAQDQGSQVGDFLFDNFLQAN